MDEVSPRQRRLDKKRLFFAKVKRRALKHIWLARVGLLATLVLGVYFFFSLLGLIFVKTGITTYTRLLTDFVFTPASKIESLDELTNIVILGKGGEGHDAPDLTDTVIFASFSHKNPAITVVSLPRDIWIPSLRAKLNSAYYWGNQKRIGGGLVLAKSTVEEIVGSPIHYALVVDFSGFKDLIDALGGIEVDVEREFVDEKYPIPGKENDECGGDPEFLCRYETVRFQKGVQIMDGETALKFVRSRNAEGDEGTDIARQERQQKVIAAIQRKIFSPSTILSPKTFLSVFEIVKQTVETDMPSSSGAILARRALSAKENINSYVLNDGFLVNPPISPTYDNLYVFIPVDGNWSKVHEWFESILP